MFSFKKDIISKTCTIAVGVAALTCASAGMAQTTTSSAGSSSSSSAQVESTAAASAAGGSSKALLYLQQTSPDNITSQQHYSGSYTVRSAPAVQPPSMGSGHPCALSSSIGISLIGGGAAGGLGRVDEACLLAQMGQGQAALIMIARRDAEACLALRQVGSIPSASLCSDSERRAAARTQAASFAQVSRQAQPAAPVASRPISSYVTCSRRDDGKILARKLRGTPFNDTQVADYCMKEMQ